MKFLKDDKREQRRLEKLLKKAQKNPHVAVGVLQDEPHDEDFSMVDLAMVHEYGSRNGRIPARSFIRSTCDAKRKEHLSLIGKFQWQIILGRITAKQALTQLGEVVSKDIVQTINNGIEPELKEVTIKRKGSSKPLIDTGRLKGSITHEIRGGA
jgi:phage gpG-like protein